MHIFSFRYYNSRYDLMRNIGVQYPAGMSDRQKYNYVSPQAAHLAKVASTLSKTIYTLATGKDAGAVSADEKFVSRTRSFQRIAEIFSNLFRAIPFLDVSPPANSPRGHWVPVDKREALNGENNFYKFFNAVVISCPSDVDSFPLGGILTRLGTMGLIRPNPLRTIDCFNAFSSKITTRNSIFSTRYNILLN